MTTAQFLSFSRRLLVAVGKREARLLLIAERVLLRARKAAGWVC